MIQRNDGFTHVELITAISVMSLLSSVAWSSLSDLGSDARHATMRSLGASLTQASVINGASGQIRGAAQPLVACKDVGRLLVNAVTADDRLLWQERELAVEDDGSDVRSGAHRECLLSDTQDPAAGKVRFFIRVCADRFCRET